MVLDLVHWLILNFFRLYVKATAFCHRNRTKIANLHDTKTPRHVAIVTNFPLSPTNLALLIAKCINAKVKVLSLYGQNPQASLSHIRQDGVAVYENDRLLFRSQGGIDMLTIIFATYEDPHEYYAAALRRYARSSDRPKLTSQAMLVSLLAPFELVDLIISIQPELDLSPVISSIIGFAQIYHRPSTKQHISESVVDDALHSYYVCKQNFGK